LASETPPIPLAKRDSEFIPENRKIVERIQSLPDEHADAPAGRGAAITLASTEAKSFSSRPPAPAESDKRRPRQGG
jgi:hypothetical protein